MPSLFDNPPPEVPPAAAPIVPGLRMGPENVERVIAERVLDNLADRRKSLCEWLRVEMRLLYQRRLEKQGYELAYVTADDARVLLDAAPGVPGPDKLSRNFIGALFRGVKGWQPTGKIARSRTPGSHANMLHCWRWVPPQDTGAKS